MAKETNKGVDLKADERSKPRGLNYLLAIAINDYEHHRKLSNCVRDAEQLVKVLQDKYGFRPEETTKLFDKDATLANLYNSLRVLSNKVTSQDNVVIYFSGHGFFDDSDKTGHLVPVEAQEGAAYVYQYFSNANLVNRIRAINSFHTFLIVDSCFSGSLFASKEVSATPFAEKVEGLPSRWALAAGQIETVEDGLHGDHSPFAKALLAFLEKNSSPLVPASELIQHVKRVTPHNARQTPVGGVLFKTGDVGGEFVFHLKQDEAAAWAEAQRLNTLAGYRQFLEAFPGSFHTQEARKQIAELEETAVWESARRFNTVAAYNQYLDKYPNGKKAREAIEAMEKLEETSAWKIALSRNTVAAFRKYTFDYPRGANREEAEKRIRAILDSEREPLAWQEAQRLDSINAYNGYLKEFPAGANAGTAQSCIRELDLKEKEKQRAREESARKEQQQAAERTRAKVGEPPKTQAYAQAPAQERKKPPGDSGGVMGWPMWLRVAIPIGVVVITIFIWQVSTSGGDSGSGPQEAQRIEDPSKTTPIPKAEMVLISGEEFEMGNDFGEGENNEKPVHTVTVSDFYLSAYETTFDEYDAFCEATGRSKPDDEGWGRGKRPVINVTWYDAVEYCNWRSRKEGLQEVYTISGTTVSANWNANGYRLPTEAEWEYAARSRGKKEKWAGTSEESALVSYANCSGNDGHQYTAPVGSFRSNSADLYDMSGNVWEWCWDRYSSDYYEQSKNSRDPKGPDSGSCRVVRGGSWNYIPVYARCAYRHSDGYPTGRVYDRGFRLARAAR